MSEGMRAMAPTPLKAYATFDILQNPCENSQDQSEDGPSSMMARVQSSFGSLSSLDWENCCSTGRCQPSCTPFLQLTQPHRSLLDPICPNN